MIIRCRVCDRTAPIEDAMSGEWTTSELLGLPREVLCVKCMVKAWWILCYPAIAHADGLRP